MESDNSKSKYYKELQDRVESEMAKFTGKINANEAETVSTMSAQTKKSAVKGQGNLIAAKAQGEHS